MDFRSEAEREIAAAKRNYGDQWRRPAFNNWMYNLPGGFYRKMDEDMYGDKCNTTINRILKPSAEVYPVEDGTGYYLGEGEEIILPGHGELWLNQTPRAFFGTIDTKLEEHEIPTNQILALQELQEADQDKRYELFDLALPAYLDLREIGYTWADLCA